jgi:hypothetical protein
VDRNLNDRIRERAYEIWFAAGCRDGEGAQHWLAAEREILQAAKPAITAQRTSVRPASGPQAPVRPKARSTA